MSEFEEEINELEGTGSYMTEEEYFFAVFDEISESVISDEYYDKNAMLLSDISSTLCDINSRTKNMPPELARRVIEGIFSNILKHGIR